MNTWPALLAHQAQTRPLDKAIRYKHYGIWQPLTWKDYYTEVKHLALGLASLGLVRGKTLLIIGDNAPSWHAAELAAQAMHAIPAGVHPDLSPSAIRDVALLTNASLAIVEDQEQVDKLLEIRESLPGLRKIIYWNYKGLAHYKDEILMGYREVLASGASAPDGRFEKEIASIRPEDACSLVPTSGTGRYTVHTFASLAAGAEALGAWSSSDEVVPLTPAAWISGQWIMHDHLASGCVLNFAESPETRTRDAREIEPTLMVQSARFWENQAALLQARIEESDAMKRFLFRSLLGTQNEAPGFVTDIVLARPIRKTLGLNRARMCYSTGGLLSPDAKAFWRTLGVPVLDLYATTEAGAIAKDGELLSGVEARIAEGAKSVAGEIAVKSGSLCKGYYDDADAVNNGWVETGDSGSLSDGRLSFADRKRDMPHLSGQTLAPQQIESRLRFSPFIKDAWVFVSRGSVAALIVINFATVGAWAGRKRISFATTAELASAPEVYDLVARDIARVNSGLPDALKIGRFVNLPAELADNELTFGGSLVREQLSSHYAGVIDAIDRGKTAVEFGRTSLVVRGVAQ
jgi:long-chain acyl-CoA synthetase